MSEPRKIERQLTDAPHGHILTNTAVWSPDGEWIVYDTRSDPAGEKFDGSTIEIVNTRTREVREIHRSKNGAHCGVATFSPRDRCVVFILGPEHSTPDWRYNAWHRQGVMVHLDRPQIAIPLDARDITPPFTAGALRGGSHVHVFDAEGELVTFTYEDQVLATLDAANLGGLHDANQRNIGVSILGHPVTVPSSHPRNHNGTAYTVQVTRTTNTPRPGSDDIVRACEESWIGTAGYLRRDGTRQRRALAFQGTVITASGERISEVFVIDLPDDLTRAGERLLQGTSTTRPAPPHDTQQRRLTFTADRKHPGLQGPRHWLRTSPDGSQIAFLMRDDDGVVQLWTISPNGGPIKQLTHNPFDVASSFTWSPDGGRIAYVAGQSVFVTNTLSGEEWRITPRSEQTEAAPRPEACVFSPSGDHIAYTRPVHIGERTYNQIFIAATASS